MIVLNDLACRPQIQRIVTLMREEKSKSPQFRFYDYSVDIFNRNNDKKPIASIISDEFDGKMRNISIMRIFSNNPFKKVLTASIGNNTGNIKIASPHDKTIGKVRESAQKIVETLNEALSNPREYLIKASADVSNEKSVMILDGKRVEACHLYEEL